MKKNESSNKYRIVKSQNKIIKLMSVFKNNEDIFRKRTLLHIAFLLILSFGLIIVINFSENSKQIYKIVDELNKIHKTEDKKDLSHTENEIPTLDIPLLEYKEKNEHTAGFLTVPQIELGLPVVQYVDNEYYLTRDFYGKQNEIGWIFLDARAYNNSSDDNTVIYGHNVTTNNMFGNLKAFLNWTSEEITEKQYIYYNTEDSARTYEIVAAYVTDYEDWSYVRNRFTSEEKIQFVKDMKEKNTVEVFDKSEIKVSDKILTLSTCYGVIGTTKRMVVHAKLVTDKYVEKK